MAVINTNYLSLVAQNNLNKSQSTLGSAIERLSSGLRINSAKDDAAGQAIANRFTANVNGLTQAARNANDGISIAQTTEGALNEVNNNLQRIRQLSVQATNGTNSQTDLDSIQAEISQRLGEITRVSEQTQFNGVKVLAKDNTLTIQVGANDNETITINLEKIDAKSLGLEKLSLNGPQGTVTTAANSDVEGFLSVAAGSITAGASAAVTVSNATDLGSTAPTSGSLVKDSKGNLFVEVTATAGATKPGVTTGQKMYVSVKASDLSVAGGTVTVGTKDATASTFAATTNPLAGIDKALSQVDNLRSDLGAIQNRFESTVANLNNTINNLSAARSRIQDADYATEVSNMTKAQILQQAGTSVLAQANQVPQTVLSLLR
ncbi:flagellin FliC [Achromobacter xylosoxidans]|uniref:Flagellin n=1 Tax=Achromobacter aegrifaciens TaxID=1287736 RepID=A0AAD2J2L4_ACHAE|nr:MULTISPECIES: flagellin FliC [Achromobacter]MBD9379759.1 flagellin FliC [Achromobacter sp. ACM02]MDQ1763344.1 flagellin FliC [Achromobacter aegrifaciens]PTN52329.1 flagellin FliC [Achromobacter xylosoxidans]CUJ50884.1 Flagellin [Achromobacter aegrifaciens]